jgi:predicted metal-binding membrane protein
MNTPMLDATRLDTRSLDLNSDRAFFVIAALIFMVGAAVTIAWCGSMSAMPGMEMPGGWAMSMTWMRMPGQSWLGHFGMFIGMWTVMMVVMMLPALLPMLTRFRRAVGGMSEQPLAPLTATVAAGYFAAWTLAGVVIYPFGVLFAELAMRIPAVSRAVPSAAGVVVVIAGALQLTRWKERRLACCRRSVECSGGFTTNYRASWRHGLRLGARCIYCCAGLNAILLTIGVMDLLAMALVMIAISAERLARAGEGVARGIGFLALGIGISLILNAIA